MKNPFSLVGKTVLVTGASSGIGRQTCLHIAAMGGRVFATGRNKERLAETMALVQAETTAETEHLSFAGELMDKDVVKSLIAALPPLDGLVHSAGISRLAPLKYMTDKLFRELFEINAELPLHLTRDCLKGKRINPGASIVMVSSVAPFIGVPGQSAYSPAKAALLAWCKIWAVELAGQKIRTNAVCPAMVKTPLMEGGAVTQEQYERDALAYPLGYGEPEDVANAIVYLLSDASKWVTGTHILLDGGLLCK
ncbi:MAG: SDR family oxidoreductase [Vampirovibrionales bacterium]|nr:SDR family oxidoreductase [Vampirovibrionales bacterium]